jgi:hypothetical protein
LALVLDKSGRMTTISYVWVVEACNKSGVLGSNDLGSPNARKDSQLTYMTMDGSTVHGVSGVFGPANSEWAKLYLI